MNPIPVRIACALALAALPLGVHPARAQDPVPRAAAPADTVTLSLAEARRLAVARNPAFLAEARETDVARAQLRQARLPAFNPEAELRLPGAATGAGASEYELSLTQEVEVAGQRGLRSRAARIGVGRAELTVRDAARLSVAEATTAYYETLAARRRVAVAEAALALNERLLAAVRTQTREGEISALEADLAEIDYGRARARVLAARREAASAELELRRLTGLSGTGPLRLADDLPPAPAPATLSLDSLLSAALARRPDLAAGAAAVEESRALATLARREALPNLRVGAVAERDQEGGDPRVGVGVGMALPLFNRNQGRVAEQQARTAQADLRRQATEVRVRTQVADAYRAYVSATEEAAVYEEAVLQPARQSRDRLETAYREGKIGLTTLLLVRNQLVEAESGYWDAWLAQRRALADLEAATAALPAADYDDPEPAPRTR